MSAVVVDASVVAAVLTEHSGVSPAVESLRGVDSMLAPAHLDAEVLSALRGRMLGGKISSADLERAALLLSRLPVLRIPLAPLLRHSLRWMHNLTVYDSLYLAAAAVTGATLLTGDSGMAASADAAGLPYRWIDASI